MFALDRLANNALQPGRKYSMPNPDHKWPFVAFFQGNKIEVFGLFCVPSIVLRLPQRGERLEDHFSNARKAVFCKWIRWGKKRARIINAQLTQILTVFFSLPSRPGKH